MGASEHSFSDHILKLLLSVGESHGLKEIQVEKLGQWEKGENYLGEVTPARIYGKNGSIDAIVKSASNNQNLRKNVQMEVLYQKEIFLYTQLVRIFRQFERSKNISDPIPYIAQCYTTFSDYMKETLILENLKTKGFELAERRKPLNQYQIQLVLETYGKWHALSFAFRQQNRQQYEQFYKDTKYNPCREFHENFECNKILASNWNSLKESFNPETDQKYIDFLEKCIKNVDHFPDGLFDCSDQYSVLIHGDGWTNNFLFKYENDNDKTKPAHLYLIDFQLLRIGSPVIDLSYFIYSCTGSECFHNLNKYLQIYHSSLKSHLKRLGTNVDDVYPFTTLENDWKKWSRWGFMCAFFTLKTSLVEQSEAINLQEATDEKDLKELLHYKISNVHEYQSRCKDMIRHFVDENIIDESVFKIV